MAHGLRRSLRKNGVKEIKTKSLGSPAVASTTGVMAAFTNDGSYHRFYPGATIWNSGGEAKRITATAGGVAADIKAIAVTVIGTDAADAPLTEALPVFTVNTAGQVTSVGSFKTITEIRIPVHDGTGATVSVGVSGRGDNEVIPAWTDQGVQTIHKTATITQPVVCRAMSATAGGTAGDIKAISVILTGKNRAGAAITETLPAFTVDSAGSVQGSKAFASIDYVDIPTHDGNGATTAIGFNEKLGLPEKLPTNQVLGAYLAGVKEATAPTVTASATALESNTVDLSSTLNGTEVKVDYYA